MVQEGRFGFVCFDSFGDTLITVLGFSFTAMLELGIQRSWRETQPWNLCRRYC